MRYRRYGDPNKKVGQGYTPEEERFLAKIVKRECWEWQGRKDQRGYGRFTIDGKNYIAHRWSYKKYVGDLIEGLTVDHLCHNPGCVNPKHLRQVSYRENVIGNGKTNAAYVNSQKTECLRGHPFSEENIYVYKTKWGTMRLCKQCQLLRQRRYRRKKRLAL